jgi:single-strand DNA-binding protein
LSHHFSFENIQYYLVSFKIKIMKNLRNSVQLIGHLGMDPEVKEVANGKKIAKFSLATTDYYRNSEGEKISSTQWHQVVAWGKNADLAAQYLIKGKEVAVQGKLNHRSYEDKQGITHYFTEIVVNEILLLGGSKKSA